MNASQLDEGSVKPSEQRGGNTPDEAETREKGSWSATASQGLIPADLGGSDAPREMLGEDPELGSEVLGVTTGSNEPATDDGIDSTGGDDADGTSDGGPDLPQAGEPDLKDAATIASWADTPSLTSSTD